MSGTEDSILSHIPDFQEDSGGSEETSAPAGSGTQGSEGSGSEGRSSAQPTQADTAGSAAQRTPQGAVRRRHDGLIEQPNPNNPNTRDLVDPVSGRVVAQGGIERRIFEDSQRTMRENNTLKQRVTGLEGALRSSGEVLQEAARLGVQPEDQKIAIRVMADFMRDPVRTLQGLVEEVKSKGYQIPFLTEGVSPGMDMQALSRMIDAKLHPITNQHAQQTQQVRMRQAAEQELSTFIDENQEANANLDVLGEMLQAQPGLPLQSAYTKMIRWAHENGLDWTQPLKAQIAALRQQQTTPQPQVETRPLPTRRSVNQAGTARMNGAANPQQFSENASWADIIRSAMQESGGQLN
jgi:hypothetical protein